MRISNPVGNDLETLFGVGVVGGLSDAELLARFLSRQDVASSEAAFGVLVERHGPMVLGVCRRMLGDDHAPADALQAVFLVLDGKAPRVRVDDTLGRWLHGVSVRVSLRARAVVRAERARVRSFEGLDPIDASAPADPEGLCELRAAIDEGIARRRSRRKPPGPSRPVGETRRAGRAAESRGRRRWTSRDPDRRCGDQQADRLRISVLAALDQSWHEPGQEIHDGGSTTSRPAVTS